MNKAIKVLKLNKAEKLRIKYDSLIKKANKTDSKKEDAKFREEANKVLISLKESCLHNTDLILMNRPYVDDNYDRTSMPGLIICLCCGKFIHYDDHDSMECFNFISCCYERPNWFVPSYPTEIIPQFMHPLKYPLKELKKIVEEMKEQKPKIRKLT